MFSDCILMPEKEKSKCQVKRLYRTFPDRGKLHLRCLLRTWIFKSLFSSQKNSIENFQLSAIEIMRHTDIFLELSVAK